ncbi:MAG TPA: type IX secretion system membrane protein PorP/SprF [Flavobacteriales bacterium]|nr:type IX secretion system membrane protein PorP/SprF [Flavobacteriales bacterium]
MKNLIKVTIRISSDPFGYAQGAHSATICMFGLCLLLLTVNFSTSVAQQLPMHSLFVMNDLLVNPAMAGKNDYNLVKTNVRYQWVGISDAPRTFIVSANIPYNPKKVGLGGYIFSDIAGPITRTGINLAYSYHLNLGDELKLAMGLFAGMMQYKINGADILLADEEERYLFDGVETAIVPDATFGVNFYTDDYHIGASFNQLFHSKIKQDLFDKSSESFGTLTNHLYIHGGYNFEINSTWNIEPSVLVKIVSPVKPQLDFTTRLFYKEELWLGVAYRSEDAVSILLGFELQERFQIGYAYDFTTSNLKNYSSGSNEIVIGYQFKNKKKKKKKKVRQSLI